MKVENAYDYMSRRMLKKVYTWATDHWSLVTENTFLYDNWAMIREIGPDATNDYVYGLDLSGATQGAGTIGGLLARVGDLETAFYAYDANGNVTDLVDTNGAIAAHYEYDPYGNILTQSGPSTSSNPYRFSTKYQDDETDLLYYGFRFYSPEMGRWASRDPVGEKGGMSLYGFIENDSVGAIDPLGKHAYNVYRQLGLPGGRFLWSMFHAAGHGYLAFRVADKTHREISVEEECKWTRFLESRGYKKTSNPTSGTMEYDEWITFSFHPISVKNNDDTGNLIWTIITESSFVQKNNQGADVIPIENGLAVKTLLTSDLDKEFRLFEQAEASEAVSGSDYVLPYDSNALFNRGGYGFLSHNCVGWVKHSTEGARLSWPDSGNYENGGVGVGGGLSGPANALDFSIRVWFREFKFIKSILELPINANKRIDNYMAELEQSLWDSGGGSMTDGF